ncbi:ABC transporter ATP-binding protein [Anaerocolumna jejuensis]|uniref:ABC transporter ATP-binding protein n=1 Tax=Anaerocolumna jejuensis TaxID=259063 RepID=UPI003F7C4D7B
MAGNKWVLKFIKLHKWAFLCELVCITLITVGGVIFPFLNGKIINAVFYEKNMFEFLNLCIIYIALFSFNQIIVATVNNFVWSHLMTGFVFDIRRAIFKKTLHRRGKDLSGLYSGDIISRMNNDATDFLNLVFYSILWGYSSVLNIMFSITLIFYYNLLLGAFTIILVPAVFYSSRYFKNKSKAVNKKIITKKGILSSYLFEIINNMQEIKNLGACKNVMKFYSRNTTFINKMSVDSGKIDIKSERVNSLIGLVSQLILYGICAYYIVNGQMKLGGFVAIISYFNMVLTNFKSINQIIVDIGKQTVSIQRVTDILNEQEEDYKEDGIIIPIKKGTIEFKDVVFQYNEDKRILNGVNLLIDAGSTIGLVGKSGIGKTTMANLIYHLFDLDSGEILIDGISINEYNLHSLRGEVGIVHQETILYDDTLRYNLSFSNCKDNDELLLEALKKAALYDSYLTFSDGLDTLLGNDGLNLSGGQKQRLAIARLFVKNPKILIFDEATSYLDSQNEAVIRRAIHEMSKDRTIIIIAHRFSTIRNCDKIAVLSNGLIKDYDTHENLMKSSTVYQDLFRVQFVEGEEYETI